MFNIYIYLVVTRVRVVLIVGMIVCCLATVAKVTMPTRKMISYSKTLLGCD